MIRDKSGVSPVVAVILLTAVTVALVSLAAFTVFDIGQSGTSSNGAATVTAEYESESAITANLIKKESADKVIIRTAMGTEYNLSEVGDSVTVLNQETNQTPVVFGVTNGERTVLREIPPQSFTADLTVGNKSNQDYSSIQNAVDNASDGDIIALKKRTYYENVNITTANLTLIGEDGTVIGDSVESAPTVIDVDSQGVRISNVQVDAKTAKGGTAATHGISSSDSTVVVSSTITDASSGNFGGAGNISSIETREFVSKEIVLSNQSSEATAPPEQVTWNNSTDWDNAVSSFGVEHESLSNTDNNDATNIEKGYTLSNPLQESNLIAHYPLQEDSGGTATDLSGLSNDGNINGPTQGTVGILGGTAYDFDGGNDYVDIDSVNNDWSQFESATYTTWFNQDSQSSDWVSLFNHDGRFEVQYKTSDELRFRLFSTRSYSGTKLYSNSLSRSWHHLAFVFDASTNTMRIYIDGQKVDSGSQSGWSKNGKGEVALGSKGNGLKQYYDGQMSNSRLYQSVLSGSEIDDLHRTARGDSTLTTQNKTFSSARKVDLTNLSYNQNGGTVNVTVIGSPQTQDEERVSQILSGNSSYDLSWKNKHSTYRIKVTLSTPDVTKTPSVGKVQLTG